MIKSILSFFIVVSLGFLIITVVNPSTTSGTIDKVLGFFTESPKKIEEVIQKNTPKDTLERKTSTSEKIISYFKKDDGSTNGALNYNNIIDATNKERIKAGLPPLAVNDHLIESAKIKTNDMISNQYFEHTSPTGVNVSDLGRKVGYDYIIMGENLALGDFSSDDDLVQAWMNSPGHRANILNKTYQEIGIYVKKGFYKNKEVWFAVQHFGTSRNVCPNLNSSLKSEIDIMNADLKKRGDEINTLRKDLETNSESDDEYKSKVAIFNALVASYNNLLLISQGKIKEYNTQISKFNSCLSIYQKK